MQLPKSYDPKLYEKATYQLWESKGIFKPTEQGDGRYSLVVPPPNANGNLHLGHGLTIGIEDIAARYHRMTGKSTLFVPGADHAGFETWVVYEKQLAAQGKSRFDYTREELYAQIWDFVAQNKANYESQFRALGASVDWDHYTYTLDPGVIATAYKTFKKMFDEGLMYRAEKLVNFCTFHGTGFADIEVAYQNVNGHLWHIAYPLTDGSGEIVVATTRPETMLGDVAVAVHPLDERYTSMHGKTVQLPLTSREIPIITDEMVDREFGSGAVKITPAHDQTDYDVAQRHDLPLISVIDHEGNMTIEAGSAYRGLTTDVARENVIATLETAKLLRATEDYTHSVGHCYKCGTIIQPLLREQWFVSMEKLKAPAIAALEAKKITFYPDAKREQLLSYLQNLKDWNVSRQIAWGIPIPAFQDIEQPDEWIFDERVTEEMIEVDGKTYRRDPDVFDTWFSSSSWPYATLGYPDNPDFQKFYPLDLMETGADILYPWVSRMIMLGLYMTGEIPFRNVYLHGLVLDEHGQKMSKSKGNVINPMEKLEIYGSDALRMGLVMGQSPGNNQPFVESKLVGARNFCNKLWNIARFTQEAREKEETVHGEYQSINEADHWILRQLSECIVRASDDLEQYRFSEAYEKIYHFIWDDLADWYIEASKEVSNTALLTYVLEQALLLAHPFAPHVTEAIWQSLEWEQGSVLAARAWPSVPKFDAKLAQQFDILQTAVVEIRTITTALQVTKPHLYYKQAPEALARQNRLLTKLAKLGGMSQVSDGQGVRLTSVPGECWLDIDTQSIKDHVLLLEQQIAKTSTEIANLQARLDNASYVQNAPKAIVEQTRRQLQIAQQKLTTQQAEHTQFQALHRSA